MEIEDPGCTIRAFDDPFSLCQNLKNVTLFYLLQRMRFPIQRLPSK